jgi:hypothetical protein
MHELERLKAGQLAGTRRLRLACGLTEFPREIFDLADTLEILDLSGNALTTLPDDLPRLHKLRVLFCSNNRFTTLPAVLGQCPQLSMMGFKANQIHTVPAGALPHTLRWLILTDNHIEQLPATLGQCTGMQKLMLAGNRLRALPTELGACLQLELLRISANALPELPPMLLELPKLTWLAYAGNPFCDWLEASTLAASPNTHIPPVDWHHLTTEQVLGEGASGTIYQAQMQYPADGQAQAVAVKLFKGDITSDGLPHHEMAACLNAGQHPQLVPVLGKVAGHPDGQSGMVLPLISPNCRNLAGPPSLDSCTRDVYAEGARFGLPTVMHIAQGVASAAAHLHARGLMHGDLYAHNILYDDAGQVFLGDFGAASFLSLQDKQQAMALQRMEVRAFGCLLQELLEHCTGRPEQDSRLQTLADLRDACLHHMPGQRPLFAAIEQVFVGLGRC